MRYQRLSTQMARKVQPLRTGRIVNINSTFSVLSFHERLRVSFNSSTFNKIGMLLEIEKVGMKDLTVAFTFKLS